MKRSRNNLGFSIIEMMLSTVMVIFLSAVSYRVLKTQTVKQMDTIRNQKSGSVSQVALNIFQEDMEKNDENWTRFGFPSIFPHQGFSYENNYYLDPNMRNTESLNDGITFLRRDSKSDRLYNVTSSSKRFCYPSGQIDDEDQNLYGTQIQLDSTEGLNEGDWVIAYQAGTSALAVIDSGGISISASSSQAGSSGTNTSPGTIGLGANTAGGVSSGAVTGESATNDASSEDSGIGVVGTTSATAIAGSITLRMPNSAERQTTALNSSGSSTGFVTKAGVVPASFDMMGTATADTSDDQFCFEKKKMRLQKIASPVSYFMDYRTSDGEKKSATNTYQLDSQGNKIRMLVRAEYVNGVQVRKYITEANEVGFTYDLLNDNETVSFSGQDSVQVIRDVGRSKTGTQLLDLSVVNPTQAANQFQSTYRIMAVKMKIGYQSIDEKRSAETDLKKSRENQTQFREIKIALDPSLREDLYQDETRVLSSVTNSLNTLPKVLSGSAVNEQIGKPLYLINNNGDDEVLVPVGSFEVGADGVMGAASAGAIYVYNSNGCAVNAGSSCEPSQTQSSIVFNPGNSGKFFPNSVSQVTLLDGTRRVVVGGVSMVSTVNGGVKRFPGIGIIELAPNESLKQKLSHGGGTSSCNVANCSWQAISNSDSSMADLQDTALISIDSKKPGNIYVASITKKTGEASPSVLYKGSWSNNGYSFTKIMKVDRSENAKVVTAISDRTINIAGKSFIAACLSKKMSSSCEGGECLRTNLISTSNNENITSVNVAPKPLLTNSGEQNLNIGSQSNTDTSYGEIQLIAEDGSQTYKVRDHNFRCGSINVNQSNDLMVTGRLAIHSIPGADLKRAVLDTNNYLTEIENKIMYLDEVAVFDEENPVYADYFQVDPTTYQNQQTPQIMGWSSGVSAVEFSDGSFGMVNGNKFRLAAGYGANSSGDIKEYSNAGIFQVKLAGISDRVVATIETDPLNINNSIITASYSSHQTQLPELFIKGSFFVDSGNERTNPTPLPSMPPSLSELSWFQLYQSLLTPRNSTGLNSNMPTFGSNMTQVASCQSSRPRTCD